MDYRNRRRLKILGRARIVEDDPVILPQVQDLLQFSRKCGTDRKSKP